MNEQRPSEAQDMILKCCTAFDRVISVWALNDDVKDKYANMSRHPIRQSVDVPYKISPIESRGRGAIATRDIQTGEIVLCERPILMIPTVFGIPTTGPNRSKFWAMEGLLLRMFAMLDQESRKKVLELHNCKWPDVRVGPLTGIMETNTLLCDLPHGYLCEEYDSLCVNLSYFNHA